MIQEETIGELVSWMCLLVSAVVCSYIIVTRGALFAKKQEETREIKRKTYLIGDKLTVYIRLGSESSITCKATIISQDADNSDYYYCQVIYPERYEEPLEHVHINHIINNLSADYRKRKAVEEEKAA